jgi:hypothetical protein
MSLRPLIPIAFALWASGCAHQPAVFRLVPPVPSPGTAATLVPPEAKDVTVASATVKLDRIPRKTACSPSAHGLMIERKGPTGARVVVTREAMNLTNAAELFSWTLALERQGCIPPNEAFRLAENIVDALPLDLTKRSQLLQGRGDLKPVNSLRIVSPVLKPGGAFGSLAETASVSQGANPGSLDVEVKANPAVIGYEIDWYDLAAQDGGPGYRITPRSAEIHIGGNVEHPAAPTTNRFQFGPAARWYELYMMTKVSANDFDFVVFSARTSDELQSSVAAFQRDASAFLQTADPATYAVLPHGSGINAYIRVKVHGVSVDLPRGNTVKQAITQAAADPGRLAPRLKVRKLHDGRLYPVEWDRATDRILSLPLEGGEEIDW